MNARRQIPAERKALYYTGMALSAIGFVMFLSTFVMLISSAGNFAHDFSRGPSQFMAAFVGIILIIIGKVMMHVGSQGLAGAGIVLDPEQARRDVEPWSRMGGGMLNDALSEVDTLQILNAPQDEPPAVIKIRCQHCRALNDEQAKFCDQCGSAV